MSQDNEQVNHEVEVKLYTPDLSVIIERLGGMGALCVKPRLYERNVRYESTAQTLTQDGIVVRLREDDRVRLTYKANSILRADGLIDREELEVDVSDFQTMDQILHRLGYDAYMIYEKYRTTYDYGHCEIVLDEMPYGNFTEIEGQPADIEAMLIKLGLADSKRYSASYSRLFDYVKHHLRLTANDLTFANFEGVVVPEDAFLPPDSPI